MSLRRACCVASDSDNGAKVDKGWFRGLSHAKQRLDYAEDIMTSIENINDVPATYCDLCIDIFSVCQIYTAVSQVIWLLLYIIVRLLSLRCPQIEIASRATPS